MINLTSEQQEIHNKIVEWIQDKDREKSYISLAGYAGTGKTTLLSHLSNTLYKLRYTKAFCTYTGKASQILKSKMKDANSLYQGDSVSTIHSLIYKPIIENDEIVGWDLNIDVPFDLIILDEASMVGRDLWYDLLSFKKPILCSGDHGQLEPIGEQSFNLVKEPDYELTEIHRQAKDNPIINLSVNVRKGNYIEYGVYGNGIAKIQEGSEQHSKIFNSLKIDNDLMILCGMNKTRLSLNHFVREKLKVDMFKHPQPNERIICLKNNKTNDLMNGTICNVISLEILNDDFYKIEVRPDGYNYSFLSLVLREGFFATNTDKLFSLQNSPKVKKFVKESEFKNCDIFDFGYAITTHKAQGSEFKRVILYSERNSYQDDEEWARWLYTGITRASEKLLIIE